MDKQALIKAFREAVDGEMRHGIKEACRPELDARWEKLIDLMFPKAKKK